MPIKIHFSKDQDFDRRVRALDDGFEKYFGADFHKFRRSISQKNDSTKLVELEYKKMKTGGIRILMYTKNYRYTIGEYKNKLSMTRVCNHIKKMYNAEYEGGEFSVSTDKTKRDKKEHAPKIHRLKFKSMGSDDKKNVILDELEKRYSIERNYSSATIKSYYDREIKLCFETQYHNWCHGKWSASDERLYVVIDPHYGKRGINEDSGRVNETENETFNITNLFTKIDTHIRQLKLNRECIMKEKKMEELKSIILQGNIAKMVPNANILVKNKRIRLMYKGGYGYINVEKFENDVETGDTKEYPTRYGVEVYMAHPTTMTEKQLQKFVKCFSDLGLTQQRK